MAYVHAVAAHAGYACQQKVPDLESVDVLISACGKMHEQSVYFSPRLEVQLKATASPRLRAGCLVFPLPVKNYRELRQESLVPKLLVVLTLPREPAEWLELSEESMIVRRCAYWVSLGRMPAVTNHRTVSVDLPRSQRFTADQLRAIMLRISKGEVL